MVVWAYSLFTFLVQDFVKVRVRRLHLSAHADLVPANSVHGGHGASSPSPHRRPPAQTYAYQLLQEFGLHKRFQEVPRALMQDLLSPVGVTVDKDRDGQEGTPLQNLGGARGKSSGESPEGGAGGRGEAEGAAGATLRKRVRHSPPPSCAARGCAPRPPAPRAELTLHPARARAAHWGWGREGGDSGPEERTHGERGDRPLGERALWAARAACLPRPRLPVAGSACGVRLAPAVVKLTTRRLSAAEMGEGAGRGRGELGGDVRRRSVDERAPAPAHAERCSFAGGTVNEIACRRHLTTLCPATGL